MLTKKKKSLTFVLTIFLCLAALFFLTVCSSFGREDKKLTSVNRIKKTLSTIGLNIGWQSDYGRLDLSRIKEFLKKEQIQMISFIGKNGTMYLMDIYGNEIGYDVKEKKEEWCKISGTSLEEGCVKTNMHTITNVNQMTLMSGHGSPEEVFIWIDGYLVCWNFVLNRRCD